MTGGQRGQTANKKRKISIKKDKTKMKNINPFKLITSLVILGSYLAFSPVAQAQPAFHGNLTFRVGGDIAASAPDASMGGMEMPTTTVGDANTLTISTNAVVESATGDFAALKITHGSAITLASGTLAPPMVMEMGGMGSMLMGTEEGFAFAADSGSVGYIRRFNLQQPWTQSSSCLCAGDGDGFRCSELRNGLRGVEWILRFRQERSHYRILHDLRS